VLPRHVLDHLRGAVGRIVVDDDELERNAPERRRHLVIEQRHVVALVVAGHDHRQLRSHPGFRELAIGFELNDGHVGSGG